MAQLGSSVKPLPRAFYDRPTRQVARDLIGCVLYRHTVHGLLACRIVETEAYVGGHDLASHSSKGRTPRTQVMFGPAGHVYVFLIYGMHHCLNVVTEREGRGEAVLIRALEPCDRESPGRGTMNGPGKLCQVLAIDKTFNGLDLTSGDRLWIAARDRPGRVPIVVGPRIGVDYAGVWAKKLFRFGLATSHALSRPFAVQKRALSKRKPLS